MTSTTTTKVGNNNEIVMEEVEEHEFEVVSLPDEALMEAKSKRTKIQTFVFFDLEATGLKSSTRFQSMSENFFFRH
jgi:hypothetical protein